MATITVINNNFKNVYIGNDETPDEGYDITLIDTSTPAYGDGWPTGMEDVTDSTLAEKIRDNDMSALGTYYDTNLTDVASLKAALIEVIYILNLLYHNETFDLLEEYTS